MISTNTTIVNKLGLHARASAKLTKLAGSFPCEVWMARGDRRVNAKSIMGVMMLAAGIGTELTTNSAKANKVLAPTLHRCAGRCPPRGLTRLGAARRRVAMALLCGASKVVPA
jgi:phosphocarrier protein HPr